MQTNWYEQFFTGLALEFWRRAVSAQDTYLDVNFIVAQLDVPPGSRVLDVPCGNGRHSVEMAKRGYRVTGIDLSDEFVSEARTAATLCGVALDCIRMDMSTVRFLDEFDGALCFGNSLGYMKHEDSMAFLRAVAASLKPGARFVIETGITAESLLPTLQARRWHRMDDLFGMSENRYDALTSELNTDYTFIRSGVIETCTATYHVYTVAELKRLLAACGLAVKGLFGDRDRRPFELGCPRLFLTAEKVLT